MVADESTLESLVDELEQVLARHNELLQDDPESALALALQILDERRCSLGVDAQVNPIDGHDCWMVRFGGQHAVMLGVPERTMTYFEELRETIQDQYDRDAIMRDHHGRAADV